MDARILPTPDELTADYELVSPYGYSTQSHCGYCSGADRGPAKRASYYTSASQLSPQFYQTLLDRYWRRSGKLMYRPNPKDSCCPHYTIRLDSEEFKPSRDQRQTINRFNAHVLGDDYAKEAARLYPRTKEEAKKRNNEFQLTERIHEAEYAQLKTPPEPAHKLVVTLEEDNYTDEKHAVYDNYQKIIHKDEAEHRSPKSFQRFLCDSPIRRQTITLPNGKKQRLGSYHQCYRLDGKLVAIGVLDLLPQCVSSVYFLYDESIHRFSPGKLGALHEIALAREGGYRWWYPGYYIHSCPKMRYKMDFAPQYILDPATLDWDPLDKTVLALLDTSAYVSLSQNRAANAAETGINTEGEASVEKAETDSDAKMKESNAAESDEDDDMDGSLFDANMPGIPKLGELDDVDLGQIRVFGPSPFRLYRTSDLVGWDESTIYDWPTIKARMAELVAAMGLDTPPRLCIDISRR